MLEEINECFNRLFCGRDVTKSFYKYRRLISELTESDLEAVKQHQTEIAKKCVVINLQNVLIEIANFSTIAEAANMYLRLITILQMSVSGKSFGDFTDFVDNILTERKLLNLATIGMCVSLIDHEYNQTISSLNFAANLKEPDYNKEDVQNRITKLIQRQGLHTLLEPFYKYNSSGKNVIDEFKKFFNKELSENDFEITTTKSFEDFKFHNTDWVVAILSTIYKFTVCRNEHRIHIDYDADMKAFTFYTNVKPKDYLEVEQLCRREDFFLCKVGARRYGYNFKATKLETSEFNGICYLLNKNKHKFDV